MIQQLLGTTVRHGRRLAGRVLRVAAPRLYSRLRPPAPPRYSSYAIDILAETGTPAPGGMGMPSEPLFADALREQRFIHPRFVDHVDRREPPADAVFVAVCNDKYAPGLEGLLLSLLKVYPGMRNRFLVYHDGHLSSLAMHRLSEIHPGVEFLLGDTSKYRVSMGEHHNHQRVGLLGYLSLEALGIEDASYVIVLDSDLLVLGDISPLWSSDRIAAVPDIGHRPYGVISKASGRPVINSGVISLPRSERGPEAVDRAGRVLATLDENTDPDIARFADQKFWNAYLWSRDTELLPQNFNTIKTLLVRSHPREIGSIKVLHLTGPKPWFDFVDRALLSEQEQAAFLRGQENFASAFALWDQTYRSEIARVRISAFRRAEGARLAELADSAAGVPAVLIAAGSLATASDLTAFKGFQTFAFDEFLLADDFDDIRPDHLVLSSHELLGGRHTATPSLPAPVLEALGRHRHRPRIWAPFYFKPFLESLPELRHHERSYYLEEEPISRRITDSGRAVLDLAAPLVDATCGELTAGVPIAVHLGAPAVVLTGWEPRPAAADGGQARTPGPEGDSEHSLRVYAAKLVHRATQERGVGLYDATPGAPVGGLPGIDLEDAARLPSAESVPSNRTAATEGPR